MDQNTLSPNEPCDSDAPDAPAISYKDASGNVATAQLAPSPLAYIPEDVAATAALEYIPLSVNDKNGADPLRHDTDDAADLANAFAAEGDDSRVEAHARGEEDQEVSSHADYLQKVVSSGSPKLKDVDNGEACSRDRDDIAIHPDEYDSIQPHPSLVASDASEKFPRSNQLTCRDDTKDVADGEESTPKSTGLLQQTDSHIGSALVLHGDAETEQQIAEQHLHIKALSESHHQFHNVNSISGSPHHVVVKSQPVLGAAFDAQSNHDVHHLGVQAQSGQADALRFDVEGAESTRESSQSHDNGTSQMNHQEDITAASDFVIPEDRVDVMCLPVMSNPLQKAGRHTVIRGRLPDDHPFSIAARNLGVKLVSREMNGYVSAEGDAQRREYFMADLNAFLKEIDSKHTKIPVIGGGELDIYMLTKEVMLLGGVANVVRKRAFRIVAQQLRIPKTCTSAASVLKQAYEKLLFHYEQRLTFDKWPENPAKAVNMKDMVCEEKARERKARNAMNSRAKRKVGDASVADLTEKRLRSSSPVNLASPADITAPLSITEPASSEQLLSLVRDSRDSAFELPTWAHDAYTDRNYRGLIGAAQCIDLARVRSGSEVIVIAMAECFDPNASQDRNARSAYKGPDFCLARDICCAENCTIQLRKGQAMLFNLFINVAAAPEAQVLAQNLSAEGFFEGISRILREFYERCLESETKIAVWENSAPIPFLERLELETKQTVAAAFCAIRVVLELAKEPCNRSRVVRKDLLDIFASFLREPQLHRTFLMSILEALDCTSPLLTQFEEPKIAESLVGGLLLTIQAAANLELHPEFGLNCIEGDLEPDYPVSDLVLKILAALSQKLALDVQTLPQILETVATLLFLPDRIRDIESLAQVTYNLATASPKVAGLHGMFVPGVMQLLHSGKCLDAAIETLRVIHNAHSLHPFAPEIRKICPWHLLSQAQIRSLLTVITDVLSEEEEKGNNTEPERKGDEKQPKVNEGRPLHTKEQSVEKVSSLDSLFEGK